MARHKPLPSVRGHLASGHLFLLSVVRQNCAGFQASHDACDDGAAGPHAPSKYCSCGTLPPPALNWIMSSGYNGSRVRSAKRLARVDFPPPAFPNTATLFIWHARSTCPPDAPSGSESTSIDKHKTSALTGGNEPSGRALLRFCAFPFFLGGLLGQAKFL